MKTTSNTQAYGAYYSVDYKVEYKVEQPMNIPIETCEVFALYTYDEGMRISFAIEGQKATTRLLDTDGHPRTVENMSRRAARRFAKRLVRQGRRRLRYRVR